MTDSNDLSSKKNDKSLYDINSYESRYQACLALYHKWLSGQKVTENTKRAYHSRIKQFLLVMEYSNVDIKDIANKDGLDKAIRLYVDFQKKSNTQVTSINACLNALNNFSHFLGMNQINVEREHSYQRPVKVLTPEEQIHFLDSVKKQKLVRDRALALILFNTGIRIGDCAALKVTDVQIEHNASNGQLHASIIIKNGLKNAHKIQLDEAASFFLRQWLEERKQILAELADGNTAKQDSVTANFLTQDKLDLWLTNRGEKLSISGIAFIIRRIGWQVNLMISTEILRRTWLVNTTANFTQTDEQTNKLGSCISAASLHRYKNLYTS